MREITLQNHKLSSSLNLYIFQVFFFFFFFFFFFLVVKLSNLFYNGKLEVEAYHIHHLTLESF